MEGELNDQFAINWFTRNIKSLPPERKVNIKKEGSLGLTINLISFKNEDNIWTYRFILFVNKFEQEKWIKEHLYLFEDAFMTRIGPVLFTHPGRDQELLAYGGVLTKKPIIASEMEHGFRNENSIDWFNLTNRHVIVQLHKHKKKWMTKRIR
jgi:hypothetical protein